MIRELIAGLIDGGDHGARSLRILRERAPHAVILTAEVLDENDRAPAARVAHALRTMAEQGAELIAIPLGDSCEYKEIAAAIDHCLARGVVVLAAAGNRHPEPVLFPARHPGVIAVGAIDRNGELLPECCRSPRIDLTAPGFHEGGGSGSSIACVLAAATLLQAMAI